MKIFWVSAVVATSLILTGCETATEIGDALEEAAEDRDEALIWRGFEHAWEGEVHRVSRLGSFIELPEGTSNLNHAARSGTAADSAEHTLHFDHVAASYSQFVPSSATIEIAGKQREPNFFSSRVTIPVTPASRLDDKQVLIGLINGFDLKNSWTDGLNSQKLGRLQISLAEPRRVGNEIQIDVSGQLVMSCMSTECLKNTRHQRENFLYELDIHVLLVAGHSNWVSTSSLPNVLQAYSYDSRTPVPESLGAFSLPVTTPVDESAGDSAIGISSFDFSVTKSTSVGLPDPVPHLFTWRMHGALAGALPQTPTFDGSAFFAHSANGITNHGHNGTASISFSPVLIQFEMGNVNHCKWTETTDFGNAAGGANVVTVQGPVMDGTPPLSCTSTPRIVNE